jgi:hypothetical protein
MTQSDPLEIELQYVILRYKDPIVYLSFKEDAELGFPEIRELTACAEELSNKKPYFILSDVRVNVSVTPEGRRISADPREAPLCMGTALLVKSSMLRLAVNFFSEKPRYPFRAFTSKQKAVDWLLKLPLSDV